MTILKNVFNKPLKTLSVKDINEKKPVDSKLTVSKIGVIKYVYYVYTTCECGNKCRQTLNRFFKIKSCKRCSEIRVAKERTFVNPDHKPIIKVFDNMKNRCYSTKNPHYMSYGGRGISICNEWLNAYSVFVKWAIENGYKKGLKIDRINNDGNYEPSNCRFTTNKINCNNTRKNKFIEYNGMRKTYSEWVDFLGIKTDQFKFQFYKSKKTFPDIVKKFNKEYLFR